MGVGSRSEKQGAASPRLTVIAKVSHPAHPRLRSIHPAQLTESKKAAWHGNARA